MRADDTPSFVVPGPVPPGPTRSSDDAGLIVAALSLLLALTAVLQIVDPAYAFPYVPLDEQGHYSYTLHLLKTGAWWPDLAGLPMYRADGTATGGPNFINHPPLFYWIMAAVQRAVPLGSGELRFYRVVPFTLFVGTIAVLVVVARRLRLDRVAAFAFLLTPLVFSVPLFAPFYGNDALATLGGSLMCLGSAIRFGTRRPAAGFAWMALGLVLASAKLTALLLVGTYGVAVLWFGRHVARAHVGALSAFLVPAAAVAVAPYIVLAATQGGPAPNTPGQDAMLRAVAAANGWLDAPRLGFLGYLRRVLPSFAEQTGGAWSVVAGFSLVMLVAALVGSWMVPARGRDRTPVLMARAASIATLLTLAVHLAFSYARYRAYGWLGDMYPRYYFPLICAYGLAMASLVQSALSASAGSIARLRGALKRGALERERRSP